MSGFDKVLWTTNIVGKFVWLDDLAPERLAADTAYKGNHWLYSGMGDNTGFALSIKSDGRAYYIIDLVKLPE